MEGDEGGGHGAFGVAGAAGAELSLLNSGGERVLHGLEGDRVEVDVEEKAGAVLGASAVGGGQAEKDVGAAGEDFVEGDGGAEALAVVGDEASVLGLAVSLRTAGLPTLLPRSRGGHGGVGAVDGDELLEELDDVGRAGGGAHDAG